MSPGSDRPESSITAVRNAANESNIAPALVDRILGPLEAFRESLKTNRVEPICAAYSLLRSTAPEIPPSDVFLLADAATDRPARNIVIGAYSHRHCFMCTGGSTLCKPCHGTGAIASKNACPNCDGLGLVECRFCGGTGWADPSAIPGEIRQAVVARQLLRVRKGLVKFSAATEALSPTTLRTLPTQQRRYVVHQTIRLAARARELLNAPTVTDASQRTELESAIEDLSQLLDALRVK